MIQPQGNPWFYPANLPFFDGENPHLGVSYIIHSNGIFMDFPLSSDPCPALA